MHVPHRVEYSDQRHTLVVYREIQSLSSSSSSSSSSEISTISDAGAATRHKGSQKGDGAARDSVCKKGIEWDRANLGLSQESRQVCRSQRQGMAALWSVLLALSVAFSRRSWYPQDRAEAPSQPIPRARGSLAGLPLAPDNVQCRSNSMGRPACPVPSTPPTHTQPPVHIVALTYLRDQS